MKKKHYDFVVKTERVDAPEVQTMLKNPALGEVSERAQEHWRV
jgi:molybdate-binding protein